MGVLLETVDAELGELPIAIVIHLQPMLTYALQGQHLVEEQRLKVAIYMIGQIVVGTVFVRFAGELRPELHRHLGLSHSYQSVDDGLRLLIHKHLTTVFLHDVLHHVFFRDILIHL